MLPVKQDKNRREKGPRLDAEPEMTKGAISMKQQVEPLQPIIDACKKGTPAGGVYLFCGEEAYLKRHYLSLLRKKLLGEPEEALLTGFDCPETYLQTDGRFLRCFAMPLIHRLWSARES